MEFHIFIYKSSSVFANVLHIYTLRRVDFRIHGELVHINITRTVKYRALKMTPKNPPQVRERGSVYCILNMYLARAVTRGPSAGLRIYFMANLMTRQPGKLSSISDIYKKMFPNIIIQSGPTDENLYFIYSALRFVNTYN